MNGDKETYQQPAGVCSDNAGRSVSVAAGRPRSPVVITPPPPSAPTEFLASQWLKTPPVPGVNEESGATLTPPPPSAPGEFLSAQWRAGEKPEMRSREIDLGVFEVALPENIESIDQLERLAEGPDTALEPSMQDQERDGDNIDVPPARLRGVPLARGEEIARVFLPDEGLVASVPRSGQALILTNQRLIAFRGVEGYRDTHMAMASEIAQCSVRTGQRNWSAILQGLMIIVGGAVLYLIVGYWLAGQVSGPNVPVLNIDVAPFIALLIILAGMFILAHNYFTRPAGAVIFHGEGMEIAFPFRSSLDVQQVYDLVDLAHSYRRQARAGAEESSPTDQGCRKMAMPPGDDS